MPAAQQAMAGWRLFLQAVQCTAAQSQTAATEAHCVCVCVCIGSADEIWEELKPALQNLHTPAAQQAMGWLALFLPTHGLLRGEEGWNDRVGEWMTLWESDAHNNFWRGHWMLLFGQVAKHDINGRTNAQMELATALAT